MQVTNVRLGCWLLTHVLALSLTSAFDAISGPRVSNVSRFAVRRFAAIPSGRDIRRIRVHELDEPRHFEDVFPHETDRVRVHSRHDRQVGQ